MREIKFRAWAHASKTMFYPDSDGGWDVTKGEITPLPNTTLMQFTGLTDENGKEIYEGDIVRSIPNAFQSAEVRGEVFWYQGHARFGLHGSPHYIDSLGDYEVIGNIYENPELLTK